MSLRSKWNATSKSKRIRTIARKGLGAKSYGVVKGGRGRKSGSYRKGKK